MFKPLKERLGGLPLVLAGPILRRVTETSVTVWVALKEPAAVQLQLFAGPKQVRTEFTGQANTVAVGTSLHVVAVTAMARLSPGIVYTYDLQFSGPRGSFVTSLTKPNVVSRGGAGPIIYDPFTLPSFCLPPKDPNQLRIIHGSCRMPHGTGPDALAMLHDLIKNSEPGKAAKRPHQLLLTGDQIYADDVAAALLKMIMDASSTLLGWDELLPKGQRGALKDKASQYPPLTRRKILGLLDPTGLLGVDGAGFTSTDLESHLISLGEYLCMYLFVWSDVLWPKLAADWPTRAELESVARAKVDLTSPAPGETVFEESIARAIEKVAKERFEKDVAAIPGDLRDLTSFLQTLPDVRRALANIPTYMTCDDHDVTDDWNKTLGFCKRIYEGANVLGRRVVQNALVAYSVCQLWGNTPEQFELEGPGKESAGFKLLKLLDAVGTQNAASANLYNQSSKALAEIVGIPKGEAPGDLFRKRETALTISGMKVSAESLANYFVLDWPSHQIVFTDSRSWRSFPDGDNTTGDFLPGEQLAAQIPREPDAGDKPLLVVLSVNAPPVQPLRATTRHDFITAQLSSRLKNDPHPDTYEAWELPSPMLDRLLTALTDKLPVESGTRRGQAILLSGDVHFSFATRIVYRATRRFGDNAANPTTAVFAQLVASSFKKMNDDTVGFQAEGHFFTPTWHGRKPGSLLVFEDMKEGYVGWNVAKGARISKAATRFPFGPNSSLFESPYTASHNFPTLKVAPQLTTHLKRPADYRYTLEYVVPSERASWPPGFKPLPEADAEVFSADEALMQIAGEHNIFRKMQWTSPAEDLVGVNNLAELQFKWGRGSAGRAVIQKVRWYNPIINAQSMTTFTVSLDPNVNSFKELGPTVDLP